MKLVAIIYLFWACFSAAEVRRHHQHKRVPPKLGMLPVVDKEEDLRRSPCNSGTWFQYANRTADLVHAPPFITDAFKETLGVWWLGHEPYGKMRIDDGVPCMEFTLSAQLSSEFEITYFFQSQGNSSFSVFDNRGEKLLATVNTSSAKTESLEWEVLKVSSPGGFLHGVCCSLYPL